jgi:hypothetical protein
MRKVHFWRRMGRLENGSFVAASIQLLRNRAFGLTVGKGQELWV